MNRSDRNALRPTVEWIECRVLLSAIIDLMVHSANAHQARAAVLGPPGAGQGPPPPNLLLQPKGQPTARQLAQEQFVAKFQGTFTVGPGRYSSEAQQTYMRGAGGSNQFLHGDTQLRIVTPADPTAPLGGEITMFDRNLNSNSTLGLDLAGDPVTGVDRAGRPTHLVISQLDGNVSSGRYVEGLASGTVDIRYIPSGTRTRGVSSQGTAIVTVRARVYSIGTSFILTNANIDPGGTSQGGPNHH